MSRWTRTGPICRTGKKFSYAKDNTSVIEEAQKAYDEFFDGKTVAFTVPDKFDPLSTNANSESYKGNAGVRQLRVHRAHGRRFVERGIESDMEAARAASEGDRRRDRRRGKVHPHPRAVGSCRWRQRMNLVGASANIAGTKDCGRRAHEFQLR